MIARAKQVVKDNSPKTMRKRLMSVLRDILWMLEQFLHRSSLVGNPVFFDPAQFPWCKELEKNWRVIRKELDEVLKYRDHLPNFHEISIDQLNITKDDLWKTYFLYAYGFKAKESCERCPETTRLVKKVPGMKTAFFSILGPGKHIPSHRGPYKGVIRYHLALLIPEPTSKCRIRVGDTVRRWEEGRSLIFDDTYSHEAWNETDRDRVVLFMDFVRPLRFPANLLNWLLIKIIAISPFIIGAKGRHNAWEKRFEKILNTTT
jgi:beta-hydroxylase